MKTPRLPMRSKLHARICDKNVPALIAGTLSLLALAAHCQLLPADWDAKGAADKVIAGLVNVTAPPVKGTHDSEFVIANGKAYIVAEANDERIGHGTTNEYVVMSIVDVATLKLEKFIPFARARQVFDNETLPGGITFVPRIIQKDAGTLRCYFASQPPGEQAQTWIIDFDITAQKFSNKIFKAKLKTSEGVFDFQPQHFHADAARHGFKRKPVLHGMFLFDSFKVFDGKTYIAINNFPGKQNALATVNNALDTFEIVGHYNEPQELNLSESAVNRLPDGTWQAIVRQDGGTGNYMFTTSRDGREWTTGEYRDCVQTGANSKPIFEKFKGVYYMGWQDNGNVNKIGRTVFNLDVSVDGKTWVRKYRFETPDGFTYPTFHEYDGKIYMSVTRGELSGKCIMFGVLE